jgi:hypothetical protein
LRDQRRRWYQRRSRIFDHVHEVQGHNSSAETFNISCYPAPPNGSELHYVVGNSSTCDPVVIQLVNLLGVVMYMYDVSSLTTVVEINSFSKGLPLELICSFSESNNSCGDCNENDFRDPVLFATVFQ